MFLYNYIDSAWLFPNYLYGLLVFNDFIVENKIKIT